jgi:hypothetical protein
MTDKSSDFISFPKAEVRQTHQGYPNKGADTVTKMSNRSLKATSGRRGKGGACASALAKQIDAERYG